MPLRIAALLLVLGSAGAGAEPANPASLLTLNAPSNGRGCRPDPISSLLLLTPLGTQPLEFVSSRKIITSLLHNHGEWSR